MNLFHSARLQIFNKIIKYKLKIDFSKHFNSLAKKRYSQLPIFQFGDCPDTESNISYPYIDMAWKEVRDLYNNENSIFKFSNYARFTETEIERKYEKQSGFFQKSNCKAVFCMGKWLTKDLSSEHDHVFHAGGGINIAPYLIDGTEKQGNKLLFVGRDFERKNGPLVLKAFSVLQSRHPDCELYIIGPKDLVISQKNVHYLGRRSYEETSKYFNLCDVFVCPSIFEAYGLVFPEALAFGLPCIGRNAFEMPYFIEDGKTGYLLKENSVEELADLMEKALSNSQMKENVRCKRDWYLKEYSWKTVAERIAWVIEKA